MAYNEFMNYWKSILSVLITLWLPLQGYAAVAMPFCQYSMARASSHCADADHSQHRYDGYPGHIAQTDVPDDIIGISHTNDVGNDDAGSLGCNNCDNCHLACSPVISAVVPVYLSIGGSVLESAPVDVPPFYYPEQLQRPPLSTLL
jgi:hypothetical protein